MARESRGRGSFILPLTTPLAEAPAAAKGLDCPPRPLRSPQRQRRLQCPLGMGFDERERAVGELHVILPGYLHDFVGDGFGDVPRPAFFDIDRYDPEGLSVLAVEQITDDGRGVGFFGVSLDVSKPRPSEPAQDKMDVLIWGWDQRRAGHD